MWKNVPLNFLKLNRPICTRRPDISHCDAHYSLQRYTAENRLATRHARGVGALVVRG